MEHERVIVHVDMDAFFASIEQRDNPAYRGKPVVVGADPKGGSGRGVVSTCSYEAREYGIHSAQPISEAYRRCPHAVFLRVRMDAYAEVAEEIRSILEQFTPDVEPISIDEAFLDVTGSLHLFGGKRRTAQAIQRRIELFPDDPLDRPGFPPAVLPSLVVADVVGQADQFQRHVGPRAAGPFLVFDEVGHDRALEEAFTTEVTDGELTIDFVGLSLPMHSGARVCALEVKRISAQQK